MERGTQICLNEQRWLLVRISRFYYFMVSQKGDRMSSKAEYECFLHQGQDYSEAQREKQSKGRRQQVQANHLAHYSKCVCI